MQPNQENSQDEVLNPDEYIGTDGNIHIISDTAGTSCFDCGYEVGPDGYCEECSADNNC